MPKQCKEMNEIGVADTIELGAKTIDTKLIKTKPCFNRGGAPMACFTLDALRCVARTRTSSSHWIWTHICCAPVQSVHGAASLDLVPSIHTHTHAHATHTHKHTHTHTQLSEHL